MNYETFFEKAKELNITNIQITEKLTIDSSVEIINGKMESYDDYNNVDYNIKAEYNGKNVKLSTTYLSDDILNLIILKCDSTDTKYEDSYLENKDNIVKNEQLEFDITKEIEIIKKVDELREKYSDISKITTYFSENYTNTRIINSNGVDISTDSHLCTIVVEAITELDGKFTSYDQKLLTTDKDDIDIKLFTEEVLKKTLIFRNKKKLESKKYDIILDGAVASRIISNLASMLSATNIRNKVSCLENKIDQEIFSNKLTIIEDPTNDKFPGYRLFDDEGTTTYNKTIIESGKLRTYIYNIKEAIIKGINSTGNGYSRISTQNMYVVPGKVSEKEIFTKLKDGIYITDYMGESATSINSVNGNISIQIFGFLVENGEIISGIEPAIMTTTIFELLSNVEEIGNEIKFTMTSTASPLLLIKNISIAR